MRFIYLVVIFLFLSISLAAQNDTKIEKKLNNLFEKGKLEKCYSKALALNKKYPKSDIPEYYITKISLKKYSLSNKNESKAYVQLKKAVSYSIKLPDTYSDYKKAIQDSLQSYIFFAHENLPDSKRYQTAHKFYKKNYHDTLSFAISENIAVQIPIYEFSSSIIDSLRFELVKFAEKQDGIKYRYAGEKPETGFDCSGFTKYIYSHIGIEIPHNAHKQSNLEGNNKPLDEARPGDLIFFGSQGEENHRTAHAGIVHTVFEDDILVIHCVSGGVSIDGKNSSWEHYWKDKVLFVKTLPELRDEK